MKRVLNINDTVMLHRACVSGTLREWDIGVCTTSVRKLKTCDIKELET